MEFAENNHEAGLENEHFETILCACHTRHGGTDPQRGSLGKTTVCMRDQVTVSLGFSQKTAANKE